MVRDRDPQERAPNDDRQRAERTEREVENKYLDRLEEPRDSFAQKRIDDQAARLAPVVGNTPTEIREAWHLWRAKEPQPETHAQMDPLQVRLSDDKNLAFASLLARSGFERQQQAPSQEQQREEENPFAAAARGAGFQPNENWGARPNFEAPRDRKADPEPQQEAAPLLRAAVSPAERQVIQAAALEAVARGAIDAARSRDPERPETRYDYFARKRAELDEAQLKSVDRDVEKLRSVPGLGDVKTAEREFEKADARFRNAESEDERAKAFTRAAALSIVVEDLRTRPAPAPPAPPRPLPLHSVEQPRSEERSPPVVIPVRLVEEQPARPELVPTAPDRPELLPAASDRQVVPLDPANLPTQLRDIAEDTTREERQTSHRDEERTEPDPKPVIERDPATAPGRQRAMSKDKEPERDPGTAPGRPRSLGKERPQERTSERPTDVSRESAPIRRIGNEGLLVPVRTTDVDDRQIIEERSVSFSRSAERDAFSLRDRERQNSEDQRLGSALAHEMFCAQDFRGVDHIMEQVREATERLREDPVNADWREVARKHEVLADEALERDDNELHLPERIALADLAMERLSAHHRLVHHITTDHVNELREAPPWERDAVKQEALTLLAVEARGGERPFEDWGFVGRELARISDQGDDAVRVMAVVNAYNRQASSLLLAEDARWEPATAERVRQRGDDLLREDAATVDARLAKELTSLRMTIILDPSESVREAARERAKEVALLAEDLPVRRSLELETA